LRPGLSGNFGTNSTAGAKRPVRSERSPVKFAKGCKDLLISPEEE